MSRIGRLPIAIPSSVTVKHEGSAFLVEGPKGKLSITIPASLTAVVQDHQIRIGRTQEDKPVKALHAQMLVAAKHAQPRPLIHADDALAQAPVPL